MLSIWRSRSFPLEFKLRGKTAHTWDFLWKKLVLEMTKPKGVLKNRVNKGNRYCRTRSLAF